MDASETILASERADANGAPASSLPRRIERAPWRGGEVEGFVEVDGQEMYCIPSFDDLPPFLISIISDSDLWMYVSSTGGLTAGRRCADRMLFPYETDNRLHYVAGLTGPFTLIRTHAGATWSPFAGDVFNPANVQRNLYKNVPGTQLLFEEVNHALGLTFRYRWQSCDEFGFVRTSTLVNHSPDDPARLELLDGLLNIQPAGASVALQQKSSCLIEAYSYCQVDRETSLAVYALNSLITDRAEPAESLHANVVWSRGLPAESRITLSDRQVRRFRRGETLCCESRLRGQRAAYLIRSPIHLPPGRSLSWDIVADVHLSQRKVGRLRQFLLSQPRPNAVLRERVAVATSNVERLVAAADGMSMVADRRVLSHHFANTLFNIQRGGVFVDQGRINGRDFARFVKSRNVAAADRHHDFLTTLPASMTPGELLRTAESRGDVNLIRLGLEYLPLTFGRRHGDPSRPWNRFDIRVRDEHGAASISYEGNWRDIFQNWEALCQSFPQYLPNVIAKFVNASTIDGYNPYRVSADGIDWETPDDGDEWGHFGYWGDHQIIYLLRLLEASRRHHPGQLTEALRKSWFTYADVPYRLRSYEAMLACPRQTVNFDYDADRRVRSRISETGADGALLGNGAIVHVSLNEKLLVWVLARLCNLVPGGGIWMNTQRPEWNDANNALAGNGLSVVTLCYLRRALAFLGQLVESAGSEPLPVSGNILSWLTDTEAALALDTGEDCDQARRRCMDALGAAFTRYRGRVYVEGPGPAAMVQPARVLAFLRGALNVVERSIASNRRPDGLFHAYNLLHAPLDSDVARIERLPVMLEGQVAAISSGILDGAAVAQLVEALYRSDLYRADQDSFLLYPDRAATPFLEKNMIPAADVRAVPVLAAMVARGDERIVAREDDGVFRFAPELSNEAALARALAVAAPGATADELQAVKALYERTFDHHRFTGRSCSMFGYEGLGCVYWHMTAKLLLAVQEALFQAGDRGDPPAVLDSLASAYERIRGGLGFNKTAAQFGAFPTDPYSHTPGHGGARQPGMTGQVKEELIARLGELGVRVERGKVRFDPRLLREEEFVAEPSTFGFVAPDGEARQLTLTPPALAFTYCHVPVIYRIDDAGPRVQVFRRDGRHEVSSELELCPETAAELFSRSGDIIRIEVNLPQPSLRSVRRNR